MRRSECWTVAYRKRDGRATIIDDTSSTFVCIPNTWRYWCADPHIVEQDGNTYVFAEMYDRVLRRGVIGYCMLTDDGATAWKVALKMPIHLSYPHIFKKDGNFYMIPESYVANEIAVYRAVSFPDRWEKVRVLMSDICAVDTTLFASGDDKYLFTFKLVNNTGQLMLYSVDDDGLVKNAVCLSDGDRQMRPAGCILRVNDIAYRPAQDCSESYGSAIDLYRIISISPYIERAVVKITPSMLNTDLGRTAYGVHTYNVSGAYEVIDLKGYETDLWFYVMRPIWYIRRHVLKLLKK